MDWFNVSAPPLQVLGRRVRLWNLFNRAGLGAHWWGFGVLQVGKRHLFYIGDQGVRALFIGKTR